MSALLYKHLTDKFPLTVKRFKRALLGAGVAMLLFAVDLSAYSREDLFNQAYGLYTQGRYDEALPLFQQAADQGDARAQFNLGVMYDKGNGVAQDYRKAFKWYQKAADQGDTGAQV